jgi:hypothetical protein
VKVWEDTHGTDMISFHCLYCSIRYRKLTGGRGGGGGPS